MGKNQVFAHQSTASETERYVSFLCNCDDFDFLSAISTSLSAISDDKLPLLMFLCLISVQDARLYFQNLMGGGGGALARDLSSNSFFEKHKNIEE